MSAMSVLSGPASVLQAGVAWRFGRPALLPSLVALLFATASVSAAVWSFWLVGGPPIEPWRLLLLLLVLPLNEISVLNIRHGHHMLVFSWGEVCVVLALALVSPGWLVVLSLPGVVLVNLAMGTGPLKAFCNGAIFSLGASLAGLVALAVAEPGTPPTTLASALGLLLAVTCWSAVSGVLTGMVIAIAQGEKPGRVIRDSRRMLVIVWAGNIAVAGAVLFVADRSPTTLLGLPPVLLGLYLAYRGYLSAGQERDIWQQLEAATRELNVLDEPAVAAAALRRAHQLFRTDSVELQIAVSSSPDGRLYSLTEGDEVACRALPGGTIGGAQATTYVEVEDGRDQPVVTCIVAPLESPRGRVGALRLLFDGPVHLSSRERQVLSTFTHSVSATLLNAALYAEAREDATRHEHQANHDSLTGLANRALLHRRTEEALSADDGTTAALLLLDLDHFKEINDALGHAAGDLLLQNIGARLQRFVRDSDVVARLGGDEFALLLTGLADPADAGPVAEAVLRLLADPVEFEDLRLSVEGSIGVACHPQDAGVAEELFRRADVAMYQAKSSRGSWLRYSADRDDSSVHRQALVAELRAALDQDQLVVHFQPQVDLETGLLVGAEALCRWQHPTRGMLPPGEFVAVAEQSGLVRPFTLRVLDLAVAECVTWQHDRPIAVGVNLSARSLLDRQLPADVAAILARHGLSPDRLILEITETVATSELEVVEEVLAELRRLGVEISVDDFGTGYSSLAFLQRTAVHELKVDQSFVAGMLHSANDLALVRATIQLAHSLGARSVAEGVEDVAMAAALRDMGCDVAQGYWLSQPLPAGGVRDLLRLRLHVEPVPVRVPAARIDLDSRRLCAVDSAVRVG
jgi:diguanylate cyclase (GGDEF)-like protein